jgi:hypothetical protein
VRQGIGAVWIPVVILAAFVVLVYLGMWRGWRRRSRKHDLAPLEPVPDSGAQPVLEASARYFGTTVAGEWLDRVVARGLGARSGCRLSLLPEGLDVHRPGTSFRIPDRCLLGARVDRGLAGMVIPPHGLLVVTWRHGDYVLDTGFRLADLSGARPAGAGHPPDKSVEERHQRWIRAIEAIVKENAA